MENKSYKKENIFLRLFDQSKKYAHYRWLEKMGIKNLNPEKINFFLRVYVFPVLISAFSLYVNFLLRFFPDKIPVFLFYLIVVMVCSWEGGFLSGLISLLSLTAGFYFIFNFSAVEIISFVLGSLFVAYLIDHTRRTREIRTLKKQTEVYALNFRKLFENFNKSQDEIKARDEFLSIASHELKTPLTTMLLKLNNMLNRIKNVSLSNFSVPELMNVLENAQQQIKWLTAMINDLLNVSLITTGRMSLERKNSDLVQITKDVIENFKELIKQENYQVEFDYKQSVIGYWDNVRIEQAITNLVSNAIRYGNKKPIFIKIENGGKIARFMIKDQGKGIGRGEQKHIFARFRRGDHENGYTKGLGVGLYITDQIVKAHGGEIKLSSQPNKGSTFIIELPLNGK